jgi:hypothetical protein
MSTNTVCANDVRPSPSTTTEASGSATDNTRSSASTTVTATPNRAYAWASSKPIAPPPSTISDPARSLASTASRLGQYEVPASPSIDGTVGSAGADHHRTPRLEHPLTDLHPARSGQAAPAADEPAALAHQPLHRDLVVPVVGGLVPDPRRHRRPARRHPDLARHPRDPARLGEQVRRPDNRASGAAEHHRVRGAAVRGRRRRRRRVRTDRPAGIRPEAIAGWAPPTETRRSQHRSHKPVVIVLADHVTSPPRP